MSDIGGSKIESTSSLRPYRVTADQLAILVVHPIIEFVNFDWHGSRDIIQVSLSWLKSIYNSTINGSLRPYKILTWEHTEGTVQTSHEQAFSGQKCLLNSSLLEYLKIRWHNCRH